MTSAPTKQKLDDRGAKYIAKYGLDDRERLVQEQKIRADFSSQKGMTEELPNRLIKTIVNVRFDKDVDIKDMISLSKLFA